MQQQSNIEQLPLIDKQVLNKLRAIMEDEFDEVISIYLEDSLSLMSDIHDAFIHDPESITRPIHTLKSSSHSVGAKQLAAVAQQMETLVKKHEKPAASAMLDQLQEIYTESHNALVQIQQENKTDNRIAQD